jgi:hypothetical protein
VSCLDFGTTHVCEGRQESWESEGGRASRGHPVREGESEIDGAG